VTDSSRLKSTAAAIAIFIAPLIQPAFANERAETLYKQGDFAGAVAVAEEEYAKSGSESAKTALVRYLTELGLDMSFKENYNAAAYAFSRALSLSPDDITLKELVATVKDLGYYPAPALIPEKEIKPAATPPGAKPAPAPDPAAGAYLKQQLELIRKLEKLAAAIEKKSAAETGISEEAMRETAGVLSASISHGMENIKRTFLMTAIAVFGAAALLVLAAFLIARFAVNRHHLLGLAAKNTGPAIAHKKKALRIPLAGYENDTKYESIDIIEAELSSEDSTESGVAQKLLEPFLNDPDIELKIRAIKTMHKYSADEAVRLLEQETLKVPDGIKMFCRLIQLMPPEKSIGIAGEVMKNADPENAELLKKALLKLNSSELDETLRGKLKALAESSGPDELIIG